MRRAGGSRSRAAPRCCSSTAALWRSSSALPEDQIEIVENDVGGGFGARGEFYPEDFLIPFAARQTGRPVKWTEDRRENLMCAEPRARGGMRRRDRLHARRHHPGAARPRLRGRRRLYAHQWRGRRPQRRAVHVRPLPDPEHRHRRRAAAHQQDAGRHLSRARPLRDRFLPRAFARHRGAGSRASIASSSAAAISCRMPRCPTRSPPSRRSRARTEFDSGDYHATLERCLKEIGWAEKSKLAGQLIDGRYHGLAVGCFIEGGAAGPKESARIVLEPDGDYSVYVGSSAIGQGLETVVRADRRRRARSADRPHRGRAVTAPRHT